MDAIEKRARELLAAQIEYRQPRVAKMLRVGWLLSDFVPAVQDAVAAISAALTPPEGYVLVPVDLLRMVIGCAYPVSTDINQRGYAWSEAYLDQVLPCVKAALPAARPEVP